jgi:hypothetical protein
MLRVEIDIELYLLCQMLRGRMLLSHTYLLLCQQSKKNLRYLGIKGVAYHHQSQCSNTTTQHNIPYLTLPYLN